MPSPENISPEPLSILMKKLEVAGIDTSKWGIGDTKTLAHLLKEIQEGESILHESENGELVREMHAVTAEIFYISPEGQTMMLKEEKQVFKDGRERRRLHSGSVSGRMKIGENPAKTMLREIKEELGIDGNLELAEVAVEESAEDSPSFPGLKMHKTLYKFRATLRPEQFKSECYVERQEDKDTYFVWEGI